MSSITRRRPSAWRAAAALAPLPTWKRHADFVFAQVGFSVERLLSWRSSVDFSGPVYAGVLVVASAPMANKLSAMIPQLAVPNWLVDQLEKGPEAGVELACQMVSEIRAPGRSMGFISSPEPLPTLPAALKPCSKAGVRASSRRQLNQTTPTKAHLGPVYRTPATSRGASPSWLAPSPALAAPSRNCTRPLPPRMPLTTCRA